MLKAFKNSVQQFVRFSLVGIANTAIDFSITNLLVLLTNAETSLSLMWVSIIACFTATLNSFFLNRRWTFGGSELPTSLAAVSRFYAIALFAVLINTSIFLFAYRYLTEHFLISKMVAINLSKLCAVAVTSLISFLGYKLYVFDKKKLDRFRHSFLFETTAVPLSFSQIGGVLTLTFMARLGYLSLSGASSDSSALSVSFSSGIFLVLPVMIMTRQLYGSSAAWLSGGLTALHPRLIEFSCNGLPEMFYLLSFSLGAMWVMLGVAKKHSGWSFLSGLAYGMTVTVKSEAIFPILVTLGGTACFMGIQGEKRMAVRLSLYALQGFLLLILSYVLLALSTLGTISWSVWTVSTSASYKDMILYSLQRLPGVLITPAWLFALLLPLFYRTRLTSRAVYWPLLVMGLFPILFYPLTSVEPADFLALLIPIHIFGSAGVIAFAAYFRSRACQRFVLTGIIGFLVGESILVTLYRAIWH